MSLHSRTHLPHLHALKTSSHWDSPPVEESHSKTGTATQYPPTSLLGGDATNMSHQIMPVAYSDQNQGHRPNHPKHNQPLSPSGEHLGTSLGPKTGISNPYTSTPTPLQGEVTICHYLWGTLPTKPVTAQVLSKYGQSPN